MWVDGGQCSQQGVPPPQPWASDSLSPTTAGPPASSSTSQQKAQAQHSRHRRREGQRERDRGKEKERPPPQPPWLLLCRPRAPTAAPTPILAQLGQGGQGRGRSQRGSCGTPHPTSYPGPLPSTATPPCPRGSQDRITDTTGGREALPSKRRNPGWKDEWGPTRIKRCQAGGRRAGRSGCWRLRRAAGHGRLDARPSVPLSIQGGSSLGGSEAGRALLKSFLCVCVLIT